MRTEDYIGNELRKKLSGHLPNVLIDRKVKEAITHYRQRGMSVSNGKTRTPIIDYYYQTAKKENKTIWVS